MFNNLFFPWLCFFFFFFFGNIFNTRCSEAWESNREFFHGRAQLPERRSGSLFVPRRTFTAFYIWRPISRDTTFSQRNKKRKCIKWWMCLLGSLGLANSNTKCLNYSNVIIIGEQKYVIGRGSLQLVNLRPKVQPTGRQCDWKVKCVRPSLYLLVAGRSMF